MIGQRLHQTATSWATICQLLNTWIPFDGTDDIDLSPFPLSAIVAVSRALDLPVTTLVPELAALTGQEATTKDTAESDIGESDAAESDMSGFDRAADDASAAAAETATWESGSLEHRGMLVLTALAHAPCPLGATEIAQALDVPLAQATEALEHLLQHHRHPGPLRLRPVSPGRYQLQPRADLLNPDQLLMLRSMDTARDGMTVTEATVLRAALNVSHDPSPLSITGFLQQNPKVADRLVRLGYLQPPALSATYFVDPDVINSLRTPAASSTHNRAGPVYRRVSSKQRTEPERRLPQGAALGEFPYRHHSYEAISSPASPQDSIPGLKADFTPIHGNDGDDPSSTAPDQEPP
ncbi:helix-turn-helix domain-containing protein [Actinomadura sp. 21ATH]|uniref:helix-turn-helix domain-containing protein n=1 Tax=Actinomadura sp. 21ATH TaxID=1735444 RepID=UPI0035BFFBA0